MTAREVMFHLLKKELPDTVSRRAIDRAAKRIANTPNLFMISPKDLDTIINLLDREATQLEAAGNAESGKELTYILVSLCDQRNRRGSAP